MITKKVQRRIFALLVVCVAFVLFRPAPGGTSSGSTKKIIAIPTPSADEGEQQRAVHGLCLRVLGPAVCRRIVFTITKSEGGGTTDKFSAECDGETLRIHGTTAIAASYGLHDTMKTVFQSIVTWGVGTTGRHITMSATGTWPVFATAKASRVRLRYMYNVCTFGYTMAWWKWPEWEAEIDWLALHGINMPLAFVGQEYVWEKMWREMGMTQHDLDEYFTGPAFLPWHWMGNLKKWGGPLTLGWIEGRRVLQHAILERMKSLGMRPVLPAFAGHVPAAFTRLHPSAHVFHSKQWMGFDESFSENVLLDPADPLFTEVGASFLRLYFSEYGSPFGHFYNGDTFNEMEPSSMEKEYLQRASAAVVAGIQSADPHGVWVVQGWLFVHQGLTWTQDAVADYLSGVRPTDVIVLDLAAEKYPAYQRHGNFHGYPFIWCMLHNYGGKRGLHGNLALLASEVHRVWAAVPGLVGFGMTMEATHQNPVVYELMADVMWGDTSTPTNLSQWLTMYTTARHGTDATASAFLHMTAPGGAYAVSAGCCPSWGLADVHEKGSRHEKYDKVNLLEAAAMLFRHADHHSGAVRYDAVDFARQVLDIAFTELASLAFGESDIDGSVHKALSTRMLKMLSVDFENVLSLDPNFDSRVWFAAALSWASNDRERLMYTFNAKNLISLWGDGEMGVPNYSSRSWAGLYRSLYHDRWAISLQRDRSSPLLLKELGSRWCSVVPDVAGEEVPAMKVEATFAAFQLEYLSDVERGYTLTGPNSPGVGKVRVLVSPSIRLLAHAPMLAWLCGVHPLCDGFIVTDSVLLAWDAYGGSELRAPAWMKKR